MKKAVKKKGETLVSLHHPLIGGKEAFLRWELLRGQSTPKLRKPAMSSIYHSSSLEAIESGWRWRRLWERQRTFVGAQPKKMNWTDLAPRKGVQD